jgi:hypothetical protein
MKRLNLLSIMTVSVLLVIVLGACVLNNKSISINTTSEAELIKSQNSNSSLIVSDNVSSDVIEPSVLSQSNVSKNTKNTKTSKQSSVNSTVSNNSTSSVVSIIVSSNVDISSANVSSQLTVDEKTANNMRYWIYATENDWIMLQRELRKYITDSQSDLYKIDGVFQRRTDDNITRTKNSLRTTQSEYIRLTTEANKYNVFYNAMPEILEPIV